MNAEPTRVPRQPIRSAVRHPDSWLPIEALGRESRPYYPTFEEAGEPSDEFYRSLWNCPTNGILIDLGLDGWLQRADALKLYELGRFAHGDILEFGTYRGLSTFLLAKAIVASGRDARIVTMELDPSSSALAEANLAARAMSSFVDFRVGDADVICRDLVGEGREFSFAFVDHSHAYDPMVSACRRLPELLAPGSFCLFHDFNDPRNTAHPVDSQSETEYGVYAAVRDALDRDQFEFYGVYGCCGLYRRVGG